ncbi:MAG: DUF2461 domain-containing protein [Bacteroidia bacterium]|nr:DUF2461 domain-containing protein [Bacteroidia bacterium]
MELSRQILDFLSDLKENNNREWFQANKSAYEKARISFEDFINSMIPEIGRFDKGIRNITARDCVFRIYRDVRFSGDKSPYKLNMGAYMVKGGRKGQYAGYYLHVAPGESLLAGGIYMPSPEVLKIIRTEIFEKIDEFIEIIGNKEFIRLFGELSGDKLKVAPRDFPRDFPHIDLLKFKSYCPVHMLKDGDLLKPDFSANALKIFEAMLPLNRFLNDAIE